MLRPLTGPLEARLARRRTCSLSRFREVEVGEGEGLLRQPGEPWWHGVLPIIFRKRNRPDAFQRQFGPQIFVKILVMI